MIDQYGRTIEYLRISVTDRCNLRCVYCMPEEGIEQLPHEQILTFDEIERVCRISTELGISKIKLTGGEPLVRKGLPDLLGKIKRIPGIEQVTLTTNGILLKDQLNELMCQGLDAVNISLDTLNRDCFQKITRRDLLNEALEGIQEALRYPGISVKINCVPLGIEGQDLCEIAELARKYPVHVRFIEMMPIGCGMEFKGMSEEELTELLEKRFGSLTLYQGEPLGNGPSRYYEAQGFEGKLGFISAVSHKFCKDCNRIRLTSQGYLKTCLQYSAGKDLREIIRNGGTDEELTQAILEALEQKPDGHQFLEKAQADDTEKLCMSQIGG